MQFRSIAAAAALALVTVACADAPLSSGDGGGIEHPNGGDQVALRVSYEGGFVPYEYVLTQIPTFSLYGDGRVLTPGAQIEIYPGPALPAIQEQRVTEEGIQAILEAALDAGLGEAHQDLTDLGTAGIADAATTVFTFRANGVSRTFGAYALAELGEQPQGMPNDEFRLRQRLLRLVERLGNLEAWLPTGSFDDATTFAADGSRVFVGDYRGQQDLSQTPQAWPVVPALGLFGEPVDEAGAYRCGVVTGLDWTDSLLPPARQANQLTPWTSEGTRFALLFRPLLPDETDC